jgi:5-methylcytosine-specific restriction protein A
MPSRSLRKCTYPGCQSLVKSGRCAEHSKSRYSDVVRDPAVKKLYNSKRWKQMRVAQLAKEPWCATCLEEGKHTFATQVDHIKPHRGNPQLFFDETNLQSLCRSHHSTKTAKEVLVD